jgi:hypothetical protein
MAKLETECDLLTQRKFQHRSFDSLEKELLTYLQARSVPQFIAKAPEPHTPAVIAAFWGCS